MSGRSRILAYGSAGILVVAGTVCAVAVAGVVGGVLAIMLIGAGLVAIVALVFFEVGLSEDRDRERERRRAERERRARERAAGRGHDERTGGRLAPFKLDRMRGRRRRL